MLARRELYLAERTFDFRRLVFGERSSVESTQNTRNERYDRFAIGILQMYRPFSTIYISRKTLLKMFRGRYFHIHKITYARNTLLLYIL